MTKGRFCILACPMLEDEIVFSISHDDEPRRLIVIEDVNSKTIREKLEKKGIEFESVDEFDFMNDYLDIDPEGFTIIIRMNTMGLHSEPKKLKDYIQDELVMMQGRVDVVGLYYGMCGNFGWDVTKWAESNLDYPVYVFRDEKGRVCDDCVGVAVGGLEGYQRLLKNYTGMLLLTPAVSTNWEDFLIAGQGGFKVMQSSGDPMKDMKDLLLMCGYNSAVKIDTGLGDKEQFDKASKELTDYLGFKLYEAPPDFVDRGPMNRLYRQCKDHLAG